MQKYINLLDNFILMRIFQFRKKAETTFSERLETLEASISKLKREVVSNTLDIDTLRDKVLRKIQGKRKKEEEEETDSGLSDDGFDEVRKLKKVTNDKVM